MTENGLGRVPEAPVAPGPVADPEDEAEAVAEAEAFILEREDEDTEGVLLATDEGDLNGGDALRCGPCR